MLSGHTHDEFYWFSPVIKYATRMTPSTHNVVLVSNSSNDELFEVWHRHLGHPLACVVSSVLKTCNIVANKNKFDHVCFACQKGKSHKLPFSSSTTVYIVPFELVVLHLWGPTIVNCGNSWYYISFVDVFSKFTWIFLIQLKSQAVECFSQFQNMVKTQFGKDIKQFRSDYSKFKHVDLDLFFVCEKVGD